MRRKILAALLDGPLTSNELPMMNFLWLFPTTDWLTLWELENEGLISRERRWRDGRYRQLYFITWEGRQWFANTATAK